MPLSEREFLEVQFMLNHLKAMDDKTDVVIKAANGVMALIVGVIAFLMAFAPQKLDELSMIAVSIPITSVLLSIISSLLLLYPKFTQLVFFEKEEDFEKIEERYYASLRKKTKWMKVTLFWLVLGIISFVSWFMSLAIEVVRH
ncbi:hypothetical protein DRO49_06445 [Candidatus Bathyarchaeota archaeon]|nr:MAG: hypothetical protein DRO49_06445 [Candidatus Bathyarchaeota archaeon]